MAMTIPAFHVSDTSKAQGRGVVFIASRAGGGFSGNFEIDLDVHFIPADDYPVGWVLIKADLNDSVKTTFKSTSVELINSYGRANPTVYLTGRCTADQAVGAEPLKGLRYWVMIADNKREAAAEGTPDIVGFAVHDRNGNRIAYATGPLRSGAITVVAE